MAGPYGIPIWPIKGFYGFCIQIFDGLFIAPADTVIGTSVPIERINGLGDAHLRGGHC